MIDSSGYRSNIGIIIANRNNEVFWAKRINQDAWQFPQGGLNENEDLDECLFRELWEECGLKEHDVDILGCTKNWLRYKLPKKLVRDTKPLCIGQKQKWYLLQIKSEEINFKLDCSEKPEFDDWQWVSYWYPLKQVISFKKDVYRKALRELSPILFGMSPRGGRTKPLNHILDI